MGFRSVLISGASSGIGRATAVHLARAGWDVFAGVRKVEDGEAIKAEAPERISPVILDVTDQTTIDAAAATLGEALGERGLAGLVNNAGISVAGPLEFLPVDELRRQLEVNVVGQIAVTQAAMPQIRRATGRIVNISSVGGRLAHAYLGPYHASKFAIEALTDTLRKELRPWGIDVVAIEPGTTDSAIWDKGERGADELLESLGPRGRELYGEALQKMRQMAAWAGEHGRPAESVAAVVERALTAKRPRTRYLVGRDAWAQVAASTALPARAVDALEARYFAR